MKIKVWMGISITSLILVGAMILGGTANKVDVVAQEDPPTPLTIVKVG